MKVEINTYEISPARPHIRLGYEVRSPWWSGDAAVLTFEPAELMSTKLRALNTVNGRRRIDDGLRG